MTERQPYTRLSYQYLARDSKYYHIIYSLIMSLSGKIAIVTGASRGIGASIALELAKQGAKVRISTLY